MTITTQKANATAHPGAPDLPPTSRRSSKAVAEEKKAVKDTKLLETRLALQRLQAVADLEAKMAQEDAAGHDDASHPMPEADNSQ
jgi:hypothetical protein